MDGTDISVVSALLAGVAHAHTARALAKAIAATLASHLKITRVEIAGAAVELHAGEWRHVEVGEEPVGRVLAPGLFVGIQSIPRAWSGHELRAALGYVVAVGVRHVEVVERVARLSRRAHLESTQLRADLQRRDSVSEIVASSAAMREVVERARLVATHATTVLVTGETGTGKDLVAHEIHRRSVRARGAMVVVNCGAIPDGLVESELFGHERGAFTGADRRYLGAFERAHRGTLFLDEVGELGLAAQAKLLRVLQDRRIRRVGGTDTIDVDVRVIAATHRALPAMVAAGTFREDLYYRLAVFGIHVPPLRDRREDLAPLASAILAELADPPPPITRAVLAKLVAHDWPGNVRELRNVLEAALIVGNGRALDPTLPTATRSGTTLDDSIRAAITDALRATRDKIYGPDGAAARLGMPPGTLQSKMRKLGIRYSRR